MTNVEQTEYASHQVLTAEVFVTETLTDANRPVVVFSLEWCEFCWSVRKLFEKCDIAYWPINLDTAEYQKDSFGAAIRGVLKQRTGCQTIPQVFIQGDFVGGCTETFDAFSNGSLKRQLDAAGVLMKEYQGLDPYGFLPKWLQPR